MSLKLVTLYEYSEIRILCLQRKNHELNYNLSLPESKTYGTVDVAGKKNMLLVELCNPEKDMLKTSPPVPHKVNFFWK